MKAQGGKLCGTKFGWHYTVAVVGGTPPSLCYPLPGSVAFLPALFLVLSWLRLRRPQESLQTWAFRLLSPPSTTAPQPAEGARRSEHGATLAMGEKEEEEETQGVVGEEEGEEAAEVGEEEEGEEERVRAE